MLNTLTHLDDDSLKLVVRATDFAETVFHAFKSGRISEAAAIRAVQEVTITDGDNAASAARLWSAMIDDERLDIENFSIFQFHDPDCMAGAADIAVMFKDERSMERKRIPRRRSRKDAARSKCSAKKAA